MENGSEFSDRVCKRTLPTIERDNRGYYHLRHRLSQAAASQDAIAREKKVTKRMGQDNHSKLDHER